MTGALVETDVCVLGGGPAGSIAARELAALGHTVVIVEREPQSPWSHAETLAPPGRAMLAHCGLEAATHASTFAGVGSRRMLWDVPAVHEVEGAGVVLVDRRRLDPCLRAAAEAAGARLWLGHRAGRPQRSTSGWVVPVSGPHGMQPIASRFLVDARGRRRGPASQPRLVSLCGTWSGEEVADLQPGLEALPSAWAWGSAQPHGRFGIAVCIDPTQRLRSDTWAASYRSILARSRLFSDALGGARLEGLYVRDATAHVAAEVIGRDWLRVGDAAAAVDPLSAQGMQMALRSGLQAAAAVNTLLADPGATAPLAFYRARVRDLSARAARETASAYARAGARFATAFWARRSLAEFHEPGLLAPAAPPHPAIRLRLSPGARVVPAAVLAGGSIVWARGLEHASFGEPLAFVGQVALADLAADVIAPGYPRDIVRRWRKHTDTATGAAILDWMLRHQLLEPVGDHA